MSLLWSYDFVYNAVSINIPPPMGLKKYYLDYKLLPLYPDLTRITRNA